MHEQVYRNNRGLMLFLSFLLTGYAVAAVVRPFIAVVRTWRYLRVRTALTRGRAM